MNLDAARALDPIMFGAAAESGPTPAGLLNGVVGLPPSTETGAEAIAEDLGALTAALVPATDPGFVSRPEERTKAIVLAPASVSLPWLVSPWVAEGRIVAVDAGKLAVSEDNLETDTSEEAVLHMETAPLPISSGGTVAAPVSLMLQTTTVAVRVMADIAWATRRSGAVAYIDGADW